MRRSAESLFLQRMRVTAVRCFVVMTAACTFIPTHERVCRVVWILALRTFIDNSLRANVQIPQVIESCLSVYKTDRWRLHVFLNLLAESSPSFSFSEYLEHAAALYFPSRPDENWATCRKWCIKRRYDCSFCSFKEEFNLQHVLR